MKQSAKVSAVRLIEKDEGNVGTPYQDSLGIWTVGVGHNMSNGLHPDVIRHQYAIDIQDAIDDCKAVFTSWDMYTERMQIVFLNMAFNLGRNRLKGFKKMIAAAEKLVSLDPYSEGHAETKITMTLEMLDSKWAKQLPKRSDRLVDIVQGGNL